MYSTFDCDYLMNIVILVIEITTHSYNAFVFSKKSYSFTMKKCYFHSAQQFIKVILGLLF